MTGLAIVKRETPEFDPLMIERLVLFARRRLWRMTGRGLETPEDYVHRAIELTLSGQRKRDEETAMFAHLAGVISSLISHDAAGLANRSVTDWPTDRAGEPLEIAASAPTPEDAMLNDSADAEQAKLIARVFEELSGEPDLASFVRLLIDSPTTVAPREIAEELHISVADVYLMRKRLQRRLQFLMKDAA
jgi:hypothetical protein